MSYHNNLHARIKVRKEKTMHKRVKLEDYLLLTSSFELTQSGCSLDFSANVVPYMCPSVSKAPLTTGSFKVRQLEVCFSITKLSNKKLNSNHPQK